MTDQNQYAQALDWSVQDGNDNDDRPRSPPSGQHHPQDLNDYHEIQLVVSRYVEQLVHGCGHSACTEQLCDTGRRNTSQRPVRRYTPRSARTIALAVASGSSPRSRLCPRYDHARSAMREQQQQQHDDGPRDSASFAQRLSDTASVKRIATSSYDATLPQQEGAGYARAGSVALTSEAVETVRKLHAILDGAVERFITPSVTLAKFLEDRDEFRDWLSKVLRELLALLPESDVLDWLQAYHMMGVIHVKQIPVPGNPGSERYLQGIRICDILDHPSIMSCFSRALAVFGRRALLHARLCLAESTQTGDIDNAQLETLASSWRHLLERVHQPEVPRVEISSRYGLIAWLKKVFLRFWDGEDIIEQTTLSWYALVCQKAMYEGHVCLVLRTEKSRASVETLFQLQPISARLNAVDVARSYLDHPEKRHKHILSFSFVFDLASQAIYSRTMSHLRMRAVHSDAEKATSLRARTAPQNLAIAPPAQVKFKEEHYLLLKVSRTNAVADSFEQLWQRRSDELLRPLRVRLGEEEEREVGHDLGGVQIELFNIVFRQLLEDSRDMFITNESTGLSYFKPGSLAPLQQYELVGLLFALAIYNGVTVPVNFPTTFYAMITRNREKANTYFAEARPVEARTLKALSEGELPEDLEFCFPLETNGLRLSVIPASYETKYDAEGRHYLHVIEVTPIAPAPFGKQDIKIEDMKFALPGWHLVRATSEAATVNSSNLAKFIILYKSWLMLDSVHPQLEAFLAGFQNIFPCERPPPGMFFTPKPKSLLSFVPVTSLRKIVEGSPTIHLPTLRAQTTYTAYDPQNPYIDSFWRVLSRWPMPRVMGLYKFVTAMERVPSAGGSGHSGGSWTIAATEDDDGILPRASTCFATLYLPMYRDEETLEARLIKAVEWGGEGFGNG